MNATQQIDNRIKELNDWRGKYMARLRKVIRQASSGLVEEWKWDTPVWSYNGNVVALGAFKDHVRINFFKGASLQDPNGLFNAGLEAKASRGIDLYEGDKIDETALKDLIRAASALNEKTGKDNESIDENILKEMKKDSHLSDSDIPNIGEPARRALALAGVHHLQDLTKFTEKEVSQLHGVGPKAIGILRRALSDRGWSFANTK